MTAEIVPEWSGLWLETSEVGYLEISDSDDRMHRPPPGWTLVSVDECPEHSSQVFRYVRTEAKSASVTFLSARMTGLLVAVCASGASILACPIIRAMLASRGASA